MTSIEDPNIIWYAYLDENDNVVGFGKTDRPLEELTELGATAKVVGAPYPLYPKGNPKKETFHRKKSGNGTDIADYEELPNTVEDEPPVFDDTGDYHWTVRETPSYVVGGWSTYLTYSFNVHLEGFHRVQWCYDWLLDKTNRDFGFRLLINDQVMSEQTLRPKSINNADSSSNFRVWNFPAGAYVLKMQFSTGNGAVATILQAWLEAQMIQRV
jgi:hypothetical protein